MAARFQTPTEGQPAREYAAPGQRHVASARAGNVHRHAHGQVEQVCGTLHRDHVGGCIRPSGTAHRTPDGNAPHADCALRVQRGAAPLLPVAGQETRRTGDDGGGIERGVQDPTRGRLRPRQGIEGPEQPCGLGAGRTARRRHRVERRDRQQRHRPHSRDPRGDRTPRTGIARMPARTRQDSDRGPSRRNHTARTDEQGTAS